MNGAMMGIIYGVVGSVIGVIGAIVGVYLECKYAQSPNERNFIVKSSVILTVVIALWLVVEWLLPFPYELIFDALYLIVIPVVIIKFADKQKRIRKEESGQQR